jgi:hypothetical protein
VLRRQCGMSRPALTEWGRCCGGGVAGDGGAQATAGVEVTLDASELDNMDESMLKDKYEDTIAGAKQAREDVSDVFEEQVRALAPFAFLCLVSLTAAAR